MKDNRNTDNTTAGSVNVRRQHLLIILSTNLSNVYSKQKQDSLLDLPFDQQKLSDA